MNKTINGAVTCVHHSNLYAHALVNGVGLCSECYQIHMSSVSLVRAREADAIVRMLAAIAIGSKSIGGISEGILDLDDEVVIRAVAYSREPT